MIISLIPKEVEDVENEIYGTICLMRSVGCKKPSKELYNDLMTIIIRRRIVSVAESFEFK